MSLEGRSIMKRRFIVLLMTILVITSQMGLVFAAKPVPPETGSALDITSSDMVFQVNEGDSISFSVNATYKTNMEVRWNPIISDDGLLINTEVSKTEKVLRKSTTYFEEAKYLFVPGDVPYDKEFVYIISATSTTNSADTDQIMVTFKVLDNRSPVAIDDHYVVNLGSALIMTPLNNDFDPDGNTLTLSSVTGLDNIRINGSTIEFTPTADQVGMITLNYIVTDGKLTDEGLITVTVTDIVIPKKFVYVALGDSIPSGVSYEGSLFARNIESYSDKLAKYYNGMNADFAYHDFAVSGYNAIDVYNQVYSASFQAAIADADVITLCVGANDIMDAAKRKWTGAIDFYNINWGLADTGRSNFEYFWPRIVMKIQELNPDVKLMVTTIYNPYNKNDAKKYNTVSGQDTSLLIHDQVDLYLWNDSPLKNGLNTIITNFESSSLLTINYQVVDVHGYFEANYTNSKGDVTGFYGNWVQDPHPDPNGQTVIYNLHLVQ